MFPSTPSVIDLVAVKYLEIITETLQAHIPTLVRLGRFA